MTKNVKFLTLNTYHGGKISEMYSFLERENADIMAFQEVLASSNPDYPRNFRCLEEIKKIFPNYQYDFAPQARWFYEGKEVEFGSAIFSRFPIIKKENKFFSYEYNPRYVEEDQKGDFRNFPRNIQHNEVQIGDKILNIYNVHGVWGFDGNDNEERLKMSKIIIDQIKDKKNVILAGDTNTWMNTKTITDIKKYLNDPFDGKIDHTFNMNFKPPTFDPQSVDILFTSSDIKVIKSYMPMDDISDHRPLVIEFEV